ncbi:MAG TPA: hypothetical protein VGP47_04275 [Parachlamydiaceae bacterium]|nr:hypothetical protein [Parachlamydiaceae bacterium]
MPRILSYFFVMFISFSAYVNAENIENERILTIYGFMGSNLDMYYHSWTLEEQNMQVKNWDYPTREKKINEHAEDLVVYLQDWAAEAPGKPIHFLTHSMGGLVLRAAISHPDCPPEAKIGKAVLLAPPNKGTVWGRMLSGYFLPEWIAGDESGREILSEHDFEYLGQFPDTKKVMVIAGNLSLNPLIEGENDGTVKVDETYLITPHYHGVVYESHKTILISKETTELMMDFFRS